MVVVEGSAQVLQDILVQAQMAALVLEAFQLAHLQQLLQEWVWPHPSHRLFCWLQEETVHAQQLYYVHSRSISVVNLPCCMNSNIVC